MALLKITKNFNRLSIACSTIVAVFTLSVILIWIFIPELRAFASKSMKFNSAFVLFCASCAVTFSRQIRSDRILFRVLSLALSLFVFLIGALTGAEYLFNIQLGLDQWAVTDFISTESARFPGRMSPIAALCFTFTGISLLLLGRPPKTNRPHPALYFLIPSFCLAYLAIVGYLYGVQSFYKFGPFIRISWQTSICLILLFGAILFSDSKSRPLSLITSPGLGGSTLRRLGPFALVVPVVLGAMSLYGQKLGYFDLELGTAVRSVVSGGIFFALLWFNARLVEKLDSERSAIIEQFRTVTENAPSCLFLQDPLGYVIYMNPAAEEATGFKLDELKANPLHHYIHHLHPDGSPYPATECPTNDVYNYKTPVREREDVFIRKDGSFFPVIYSISPFLKDDDLKGTVLEFRDITAQKRIEREMATLAAIVKSSSDAIIGTDLDGIITSWNEAATRIYGFTASEMIGKSFRTLIPSDRMKDESYILSTLKAARPVEHYETRRLTKSGQLIDVSLSVSAIYDRAGQIIGIAKIARDISEKKHLDNALRASQEKFSVIYEKAPYPIILLEMPEGRYADVNEAWSNLFEFTKEEALGKTSVEIGLHPDAVARKRFFEDFQKQGYSKGSLLSVYKKSGEQVLITCYAQQIQLEDKTYLLATMEDVTARKRAEMEKEFAAQRTMFLSEATKIFASSLDYESTLHKLAHLSLPILGDWCVILMANAQGQIRPTAYAHRDPSSLPLLETMLAQHSWEQASQIASDVLIGNPRLIEKVPQSLLPEALCNIGCRSCIAVPIRAHEKFFGAMVFVTSNDFRIFHREDLQLAEELGRRTGVSIENSLLFEEAQKAIQARDEFLSIASHELKTPITSLRLNLQMTQRSVKPEQGLMPKPEKLARILQISNIQVDRLTALVDDLLDVSKIEAGKMSYNFEEVDLRQLVLDVVERFADELVQKNTRLEVNTKTQVIAYCDRFRMEQVIINLISNAIKYGDGKTIEIGTSYEGSMGQIYVKDHGMGIPSDKISRVFERFERVNPGLNINGLGLGLYISNEIVKAHEGQIHVESAVGKGSTFTVEIPLKPDLGFHVKEVHER